MALRDKLRSRVEPMLEPGEQIQAIFPAQSGPNPAWRLLTTWILFWTKYWIVVATSRRIAVFRAGMLSPTKLKALDASFPRDTPLAEPSGTVFSSLELGGRRYWVHRRFWKDVQEARAPRMS